MRAVLHVVVKKEGKVLLPVLFPRSGAPPNQLGRCPSIIHPAAARCFGAIDVAAVGL